MTKKMKIQEILMYRILCKIKSIFQNIFYFGRNPLDLINSKDI